VRCGVQGSQPLAQQLLPTSEDTPVRRANRNAAIRNHFDSNTSLYVDKIAENYGAICGERLGLLEQFLEAHAGEPLSVLDVGCGAGVFTDLLLSKYPTVRVYGLDSSIGMLARNTPSARKNLILGDARSLPFRTRSFDLINLDTVMHHLVDFESYQSTLGTIEHFMTSLRGLLKPGGFVIVREIYHEFVLRENLGTRLMYELSTLQLPEMVAKLLKRLGLTTANAGVCFLTRKQWRKIFRETGFTPLLLIDKPWASHHLRLMGFRHSGDLYYTLSPDAEEDASYGVGKETVQSAV
jgi:SAM-dependent methyltransferase